LVLRAEKKLLLFTRSSRSTFSGTTTTFRRSRICPTNAANVAPTWKRVICLKEGTPESCQWRLGLEVCLRKTGFLD
jgi:hypothetical protein